MPATRIESIAAIIQHSLPHWKDDPFKLISDVPLTQSSRSQTSEDRNKLLTQHVTRSLLFLRFHPLLKTIHSPQFNDFIITLLRQLPSDSSIQFLKIVQRSADLSSLTTYELLKYLDSLTLEARKANHFLINDTPDNIHCFIALRTLVLTLSM